MRGKVSVFGSINMDLVARVRRFPAPGETIKGKGFQQVPGGKGANQAVAASRLGGRVSMYGLVGTDVFGEELSTNLKRDGVGTERVETRQGSSGLASIQVDDGGENQIVIIPGANGKVDEEYVDKNLDRVISSDVLLLQLEIPFSTTAYLLQQLSSTGSDTPLVVLDPAPARDLSDLELPVVDYLTPNEGELQGILSGEEDPGAEILSRGVKALVITRGGEGAEFISGERHFSVPGFEVEVEDTTAAGDAFAGALAVGLAEGIEVEKIVEFANAAGALAAGSSGAQPSLPDRTRTIEFLEERTDGSYLKGGE